MAHTKPSIRDAQRLADVNDCQAMVVLYVKRNGDVGYVTYGETKFGCKVIGDWTKGMFNKDVTVSPFQTAFGWGNGGIPKKLTAGQLETLSVNQKIYIENNTAKDAVEWN